MTQKVIKKPKVNSREELRYKISEKKHNRIMRQMKIDTFESRIKMQIMEEYENGRFFDIPSGLFDENKKYDRLYLERLRLLFEKNNENTSFIPQNLYKIKISPLHLYTMLNDRGKENDFISRVADHTLFKPQEIVMTAYKASLAGIMSKDKVVIGEESKNDVYERRLYVYLMDVYRGVTTIKGEQLENVLPMLEQLDDLYIGNKIAISNTFLRRKDRDLRIIGKVNDDFSSKDIDDETGNNELIQRRKEMMLKIIDVLKESGTLKELIEKENQVIQFLNMYLPSSVKLDNINEEELLESFKGLDVGKLEDLEYLLLSNRNFANKLAHVYEDYMLTNVFVNACESEKIFGDKTQGVVGIKDIRLEAIFSFADAFMQKDFFKVENIKRENDKADFVANVLKLNLNYITNKRTLDDNMNDVLRRMKIKMILNPSRNECDRYNVLSRVSEILTSEDLKTLKCQGEDVIELDRIIKKVFGDDEKNVTTYVKKEKYGEIKKLVENLECEATSIADKIIADKIDIDRTKLLIKRIAISLGKINESDVISSDVNGNIYEVIKYYKLTEAEVLKGLVDIRNEYLNELPEEVRSLPKSHLKLPEEFKKAKFSEFGIFMFNAGYKDENEAKQFLDSINEKQEKLPEIKQKIMDFCDKPEIKNHDSKIRYCKAITDRFIKLMDDYYQKMSSDVELGIRDDFPSAFAAVSLLLLKEKSVYQQYFAEKTEFKSMLESVEQLEFEQNFTMVKFSDLLRELHQDMVDDGIIKHIDEVLEVMAKQVDTDKSLYKVKHKSTVDLLSIAKRNPDRMYIEGNLSTEYRLGIINLIMSGSYQKNSCHNKFAELDELSECCSNITPEPDCFKKYYVYSRNNTVPLNTYIYQNNIGISQVDGFQKVARMIGVLDDNKCDIDVDKLSVEEKEIFERVKDLKTNNPIQYESIKPRFLMGAGVEYYKSYYGISGISYDQVVEQEEAYMKSVLDSICVVKDDKIDLDRVEIETSFENGKFKSITTYQGAIQEGIKLQNRISMQDKQEEK